MENKEGIMSFIKQLFSNAKANEEENIEKMENIDEETKKDNRWDDFSFGSDSLRLFF